MLDRRVATVMHRLSIANVGICPVSRALAGWTLHTEELYREELREDARVLFGLRVGRPSVLALAPMGAAARAGVREDDVIMRVNGRDIRGLTSPTEGVGDASYDTLGRQSEVLDAALSTGEVELVLLQESRHKEVIIVPDRGCGYAAQVLVSEDLNAGADGQRISITSALVAYAISDDDLAFLLGHELAHNILRHAERPRPGGLSALFGRNGRTPSQVRQAEIQADRVGMFLASRAGYDVSRAASFRRRFALDNPMGRYWLWGYPSEEERARAHEETAKEIEDLRREGAELKP